MGPQRLFRCWIRLRFMSSAPSPIFLRPNRSIRKLSETRTRAPRVLRRTVDRLYLVGPYDRNLRADTGHRFAHVRGCRMKWIRRIAIAMVILVCGLGGYAISTALRTERP